MASSTNNPLPSNTHISTHPCVAAKLSLLRSTTATAAQTKTLIHDLALLIGSEALASAFTTTITSSSAQQQPPSSTQQQSPSTTSPSPYSPTTPLNHPYAIHTLTPSHISLVPILRSGLGMLDALQTLLPVPVPVHHLGMYRDVATGAAVEYYNNLPRPGAQTASQVDAGEVASHQPSELAILVDPIIATGATACAAIDTLRDWGVGRILLVSVLSCEGGLRRAAEHWAEGVEIWSGAVDEVVDGKGYIVPGVGDVGDRLFLTGG